MQYNGNMDERVIQQLFDLNSKFYQTFAVHFAQTRQRIQLGVRKILASLPNEGKWLDVGCGNGNLALAWIKSRRKGLFVGVDGTSYFITAARQSVQGLTLRAEQVVQFEILDFRNPDWHIHVPSVQWDGVFCFATLHHIPSFEHRLQCMQQIRHLIKKGSVLYISNWQLQNSPKLVKRMQAWDALGLSENMLEKNDCLMDWRSSDAEGKAITGLRYVHIIEEKEMVQMAAKAGFRIEGSFYSDGKNNQLSLYHVMRGN